MRIAKYLAHCGLQSRRKCEEIIKSGLVNVDGKIITDLSYQIQPSQVVKHKNTILKLADNTCLWMFNKPKGFLCSTVSQNRFPTIFNLFPKEMGHVISVGRLDLNSQGLLLLTNNGDLARHLELPDSKYRRSYNVRIFGRIPSDMFEKLEQGITIDGFKYSKMKVKFLQNNHPNANNQWINITLTEGKNREIRRVMEHFNLQVSKLMRVSYANLKIANLGVGQVRLIPTNVWKKNISWKEN